MPKRFVQNFWENTEITLGLVQDHIPDSAFIACNEANQAAAALLQEVIETVLEDDADKARCRYFVANSSQKMEEWFALVCFHIEASQRAAAIAYYLTRILRGEVMDRNPLSYPDQQQAMADLAQRDSWTLVRDRIEMRCPHN